MKKTFLFFTTLTFLFSSVFLVPPKSASADLGLLGALVKNQASDVCINNIARGGLPFIEQETFAVDEDEDETFTIIEDEEETFTIIKDEGDITGVFESSNSVTPFSISNFKNVVATSDLGSKMIIPLGQFTNYGYCHTFKGHMLNSNGNKKYSKLIGGEYKSQFQYPRYPETTMDIVMNVVNGTTTLTCQTNKPTRCTKEAKSNLEGQNVRVVLERGSNFANYSNYKWVVITAYPFW